MIPPNWPGPFAPLVGCSGLLGRHTVSRQAVEDVGQPCPFNVGHIDAVEQHDLLVEERVVIVPMKVPQRRLVRNKALGAVETQNSLQKVGGQAVVRLNPACRGKLYRQPGTRSRQSLTTCSTRLELRRQVSESLFPCVATARHLPPVDHGRVEADRLPMTRIDSDSRITLPHTDRIVFGRPASL